MRTLPSETVVISDDWVTIVTIIAENETEITAEKIRSSEAEVTLEDIRKKYENYSIITVICETPLDGVIYQYGNYNDGSWYNHGKTVGYA